MNKQPTKKASAGITYTILTLMILTVICVTVYAYFFSAENRKEPSRDSISESAAPEVTDNVGSVTPKVTESAPETLAEAETAPSMVADEEEAEDASALPDNTPPEFILPASGYILKPHDLTQAVFSATMNDYRIHRGIDIEASIGDDVLCSADGTVESCYVDPFMGTCVEVAHSGGFVSYYKNLSPELPEGIEAGAQVSCGQVIGSVGESAIIEIADTAHLHFELSQNEMSLDPTEYLPEFPSAPTPVEE